MASTTRARNGQYVDNNISSLSSGGFNQSGQHRRPGRSRRPQLGAVRRQRHACTPTAPLRNGSVRARQDIELSGGTSESSPLTAAAAADVIQAYASTHGGTDPSPSLVKQILMSTATDIGAPADRAGRRAAERPRRGEGGQVDRWRPRGTPSGGLLVSPNQVNVQQAPGAADDQARSRCTNTGSSTRFGLGVDAGPHRQGRAATSGSFCMQPSTTPTTACPANTGSFPIWSGVTEVYQAETFTVPGHHRCCPASISRRTTTYSGQTSLLHFALFEPDGTYAGYSLPQGLGDYGDVEVANPPAGHVDGRLLHGAERRDLRWGRD